MLEIRLPNDASRHASCHGHAAGKRSIPSTFAPRRAR
jgi:hypothetical protein